MSSAVYRWLGLRPGELLKTTGMFLYLLTAVGAFITGRIARDALFLTRYDIGYLPYMYVWVAGVMVVMGYSYSKVADRFRRDRLVVAVTSVLLICVLAARTVLFFPSPDWFFPILYVFVEVMGGLLIIQFWTFANDVYTTREGKRLFGLIGAGGVVATICAGATVGGLADVLGTENLLFMCAGLLSGCLVVIAGLSRICRPELVQAMAGGQRDVSPFSIASDWNNVFSSRHLKVIAWIVLFSFIAVTIVDYQFKVISRITFLNREDQLSGFFGKFYAVAGILSFFIQLLLTGRLLQRFGIILGLMLLPVLLCAGSTLLLLIPSIWAITFLKGADNVFRYTINDATTQVLYLPVPSNIRGRAKAFIDGILKPLAQGIAGLALAWTATLISHRIHWLSLGTLLVLLVWMLLVLNLKREYVRSLASTLHQRRFHFGMSSLIISGTQEVEALHHTLLDQDENQVLHALEMLPFASRHDWSEDLGRLLDHDSARVRLQVLRTMEEESCRSNVERLLERFNDSNEQVRSEAVIAYCNAFKEKAMGVVEPLLQDQSVSVRAAAVTGLMRFSGLDGIVSAADSLKAMLASADPICREKGAWVIGKVGVRTFYRSLMPLLKDPEASVRQEAIRAAGYLRAPELMLPMIYLLADGALRKSVAIALSRYGPALIPTLRAILDNPQEEPAIRRAIPQVLARIDDQLSMDVLCNILDKEDTPLRTSVLTAILQLHGQFPELRRDTAVLRRTLHRELKLAFQWQTTILELSDLDSQLLLESIRRLADRTIERVFCLLRLIYPRRHLETIHRNLASPLSTVRANSLELLDNVLDAETRRCLVPLLEEKDLGEIVETGDELFPLLHLEVNGWLHRLLTGDHDWTIVCTLETIGRLGEAEYIPDVRMMLSHSSHMVREAAAFCLKNLLNSQSLSDALAKLFEDPIPRIRDIARFLTRQAAPSTQ